MENFFYLHFLPFTVEQFQNQWNPFFPVCPIVLYQKLIPNLSLETRNHLIIELSSNLFKKSIYSLYRYVIRYAYVWNREKRSRREIISQHCSTSNTIRATNRFKDRFFRGIAILLFQPFLDPPSIVYFSFTRV